MHVSGVSYRKLLNLFKSVRKQNSTSNPFWLWIHWSQVLVGTIEFRWNHCSHYFAQEDLTIFFSKLLLQTGLFNSENSLRPFQSHCDNPKFTPFDYHTRLVYILILCEGSGWGLMKSWELVKTLTVSWEITCFFFADSWDQLIVAKWAESSKSGEKHKT